MSKTEIKGPGGTRDKLSTIGVFFGQVLICVIIAFAIEWYITQASKNESSRIVGPNNFTQNKELNDLNMLIVDGDIYYLSKDGKYVFQGNVLVTETGENLTLKYKNALEAIKNNNFRNASLADEKYGKMTDLDAKKIQESPDEAIQSYNEAMKKRLQYLASSKTSPTENPVANQSDSKGEKRKNEQVDVNQIQDLGTSILYRGVEINKIGFDKSGNKLTTEQRADQVKKMYASVAERGEAWSIVYPATGEEKIGIAVFSDPTCGYCKLLHESINELNNAGVTVRYLMFPRSLDLGSDDYSAQTVVAMLNSAWCSENPRDSFNLIYSGIRLPVQDCSIPEKQGRSKFPVNEHFMVGKIFGIDATPLSFTSDGKEVYGFENTYKFLQKIGLR